MANSAVEFECITQDKKDIVSEYIKQSQSLFKLDHAYYNIVDLIKYQILLYYAKFDIAPIHHISKWLQSLKDVERQAIADYMTNRKPCEITIPKYLIQTDTIDAILRRLLLWRSDITAVTHSIAVSKNGITISDEIRKKEVKMLAIEHIEAASQTDDVYVSLFVLMKNNYVVQARAFMLFCQNKIKECKNVVAPP